MGKGFQEFVYLCYPLPLKVQCLEKVDKIVFIAYLWHHAEFLNVEI